MIFATGAAAQDQDLRLFTLGAGDVTGGYYAAATAICDTVNTHESGALRCSPDPTTGSIYNLDALRSGELDFALVQSDWHRRAYEGSGQYTRLGPMADLRSVMGLYGETLTILARRDAAIAGLTDLVGKRVDVGHPASGRRATVDQVLDVMGFDDADFTQLSEFPVGAALDALCEDDIDATLLIVGHPNAGVGRVMQDCDAVLVPLSNDDATAIIAGLPDMKRSIISRDSYPEMETGISSVAVTATVVTRADIDPVIVESLVRNTLANLDILGRKARVLQGLTPAEMHVVGLTAPLHPGAEQAFAEAGLE
jgi:TRAP transporter TAXI family solute receptor